MRRHGRSDRVMEAIAWSRLCTVATVAGLIYWGAVR